MRKFALLFFIVIFGSIALSIDTTADEPNESEQTVNVTAKVSASTVKVIAGDSAGTGFFITPHAVLTNEHVIHKLPIGAEVTMNRKDRSSCFGTVTFKDEVSDLALIATECTGAPLTITEKAQEGETILAVGHPLGFDFTASKGIVSNLDYVRYIQFDARIQRGSSGGVLANLDGEVVGIVTAVAKESDYIGLAVTGKRINQFLAYVRKSQSIE